MPYKIFKEGDEYCVHKENADGSKGDRIGCHSTREKALSQQRAILANESKERGEVKSVEAYPYYVPMGITSFAELDEYRAAMMMMEDEHALIADYKMLIDFIAENPSIENKDDAFMSLAKEYSVKLKNKSKEKSVVGKVVNLVSGLVKKDHEEENSSFMIFKDRGGRLRFVTKYSNKFRDDDRPVKEIISENSHRRFAEMVDKGIYPMPELWLWHVPEWKFGQADWLAYDDSGFAMASGLIDEGKEHVATWLSKQKGVRTSHGMPPASIVRDPDDPSIIVAHQTVEISPLPDFAAANKMTGFLILGNESKETGMAIPTQKLQQLMEKWNADPELLKQLELSNEADAQFAKDSGIDSKEVGDEVSDESTPEQETPAAENVEELEVQDEIRDEVAEESQADEDAEVANKAAGDSPTREEIAEAVVNAVRPIIEENRRLADEVAALRKEISQIKETDEEKIAAKVKETPVASLGALVANRLSVLNSKETEIDGRTALAKSHPRETEKELPKHFGINFIDNFINEERSGREL